MTIDDGCRSPRISHMCRVAGTAVLVIVLAASHSTAAIGGDGSSPDSAGEALGIVNVVLVPAVPRGPDKRAVREAVSFVRHTRAVMRPRLPLQLFADSVTRRRLDSPSPQWTFGCANASRLWDYHADAHTLHSALQPLVQRAQRGQGEGQGPPGASPRDFFWLSKFNAMLSARFERSLYMDTDVYVLQPVFAHALLTHGLGVHDVAAVIDRPRPRVRAGLDEADALGWLLGHGLRRAAALLRVHARLPQDGRGAPLDGARRRALLAAGLPAAELAAQPADAQDGPGGAVDGVHVQPVAPAAPEHDARGVLLPVLKGAQRQ